MKAGRFTEKMTVQRVETTLDQFGGETQTWTDRYLDVWCQPMPIGSSAAGGGEYNDDAQMQADAKYEFVCRYLPGVEYTDRIYWSGGYFDIYQIFPIGRREGMRIRGSWSDDQGDAWSMGGLNAEQVVSGTGGLTLSQVTAEYEGNDTGQTFPELVTFYNDANSGGTPQIAYPSFLHMNNFDDTTNVWGPNSYTGRLNAGALNAGPAPTNILHVAEVDFINDQEFLKTLVNNNEFGNKHRFTFDDGTEATEVYSNNPTSIDNNAYNAGYTGTNPRYIIDHYTGLGWYLNSHNAHASATGEWYDSRGMYDHYTDVQDFIDKPSTFTYGGFTDWRRPSIQEWTASLGNQDVSNYVSVNELNGRDVYFPPLNQYARGYGALVVMLGPHDHQNNNAGAGPDWWFSLSQTNGNYVTLASEATFASLISGQSNTTYVTLMCRRHYDNR